MRLALVPVTLLLGAISFSACGGRVTPDDHRPPADDPTSLPTATSDPTAPPTTTATTQPTATATGTATTGPTGTAQPWDPPRPAPPPVTASEWEWLQFIKGELLGTWQGTAATPWRDPDPVEITFRADGSYSAHCLVPSELCTVFYYGSDADSPTKVYDVFDVTASRQGVGTIYVWSTPGSWTGDMKRIDATTPNRLTFEFYNGEYGPIRYVLRRVH